MADKKKRRGELDDFDFEELGEPEFGGRGGAKERRSKGGAREAKGRGSTVLEPESEVEYALPVEAAQPEAALEVVPEPEETLPAVEEARFFIDPEWYDRHGLSFNAVAQGRLCSSCTSKLGSFVEERLPVVDPKSKRVTFEYKRVPYAANPLPVIRDCCSRSRDYVTPDTPLLEAIFRVFLANGNQPMPLSMVREHLMTYMPEMAALRSDYPVEMLERLIRADKSYGLREQLLPTAV